MPERTRAFDKLQIGPESSLGSGGLATRTLTALSMIPTIAATPDTFRAQGSMVDTSVVNTSERTNYAVTGRFTFTEGNYPLASVLCKPTITTPAGATLTRDFYYAWNTSNPNDYQSYVIEMGNNAVRANTAKNLIFNEIGLTYSKTGAVVISGAAFSQPLTDDTTRVLYVTGSPTSGTFTITVGANTTGSIAYNASASAVQSALTAITALAGTTVTGTNVTTGVRINFSVPFRYSELPTITTTDTFTGGTTPASHVDRMSPNATALEVATTQISPTTLDYYIGDTFASLPTSASAGTALHATRMFDITYKTSGRYGTVDPVNSSLGTGFDTTAELPDVKHEYTWKVAANSEAGNFLRKLRNDQKFFLLVKATGQQIETGFNYEFWNWACLSSTGVGAQEDIGNGKILGYTFSGTVVNDPVSNIALAFKVRTNITGL